MKKAIIAALGAIGAAGISVMLSRSAAAAPPPPPPPADIQVIGAEITSPADKTISPGGLIQVAVDVHNYSETEGGVNIKLTYDGIEFVESPVGIVNVLPYSDKTEIFALNAPGTVSIYDICAEEVA